MPWCGRMRDQAFEPDPCGMAAGHIDEKDNKRRQEPGDNKRCGPVGTGHNRLL